MLNHCITNATKRMLQQYKGSKNEQKEKQVLTTNGAEISRRTLINSKTSSVVFWKADAKFPGLLKNSLDLILTSPPYWQKRDYNVKGQIGLEKSAEEYVESLIHIMDAWKLILKNSGSLFLNIGDSYHNGRLLEIPSMIIIAAQKSGWILRHRIIWEKPNSTPHAAHRRLALREEYILHFTLSKDYYWDLEHYKEKFSVSNVWRIAPTQHKGAHLAPFPEELVERILRLACPKYICIKCGKPLIRQTEKTMELDESRPQARRAMKIFNEAKSKGKLTEEHIAAVQATGISDAGKSKKIQSGAGRNSKKVQRLAKQAKAILGGYFREFTFAKKRTVNWKGCSCRAKIKSGVVYDPFVGTGTTLRVASKLGFTALGSDLHIYDELFETSESITQK